MERQGPPRNIGDVDENGNLYLGPKHGERVVPSEKKDAGGEESEMAKWLKENYGKGHEKLLNEIANKSNKLAEDRDRDRANESDNKPFDLG